MPPESAHTASGERVAMAGFVNFAVWENTGPENIRRKGTPPGGAFSCIPWDHIFLISFLLRRQGRLVFSNWAVFGDRQPCKKPLFRPLTSVQSWALGRWVSGAQEPVIEHRRSTTDFALAQIFWSGSAPASSRRTHRIVYLLLRACIWHSFKVTVLCRCLTLGIYNLILVK